MLEKVQTQNKSINEYKKFITEEQRSELFALANKLKGKKIVHINATGVLGGGGVAEILHSLIPLMNSIGVDTEWYIIKPDPKFFEITNKIHNSLQGNPNTLTEAEREFYIAESKRLSSAYDNLNGDLFIIHDPQPLLLPRFSKKNRPCISRIHIDLSRPNPDTWNFLLPYFKPYENIIVSTSEFYNNHLPREKVIVFPPAIDPLSAKNDSIKLEHAHLIVENLGINPSKPTISQVSRLDPFKDPVGVIKAFYLAKKEIPNLQLILLAQAIAKDNPLAKQMYDEVKKYATGDNDIFLFYDPDEIRYDNDIIVNAIQLTSDIIIQKSTREGFGLTVTEAMWKEKAVIGGRVGGIKIQIRDGFNGHLVSTVEHCASRIVELMKDKRKRNLIGKRAKKSVQQNFLITRLLKDHLETSSSVTQKYIDAKAIK